MRIERGPRRRVRRLPVFVSASLAVALSVGLSATAFASTGRTAAKTSAPSTAARMLSAGQAGTRSQVPWAKVGSGWALAEITQSTTKTAKPIKLELISPSGVKYWLYQWPAGTKAWQLIGWSGDKTRALFDQISVGRQTMHELVLATGHLLKPFTLPATAQPTAYTDPDGKNIVAADNGLVRYNLSGKFQARLITGTLHEDAISAPNGISYVVSSGPGADLVSNLGGVIRSLPVPNTDPSLGCIPVRWWNSSTALVSCLAKSVSEPRLWLVPVSGAKPEALTPQRGSKGPDLGDLDGWRMHTGLYVQALGACGTVFIGKQAANGAVKVVRVPGSPGNNVVSATSGNRMLVQERNGCTPSTSLVWFNPASGAVQTIVRATNGELGVVGLVAFNREGNQPVSVP